MDKLIASKAEYLAKCKELAKQHFTYNGMLVSYIRKKRPRFIVPVDSKRMQELKELVDAMPKMSEKDFRMISTKLEEPMSETAINEFRTVRSIVQANKSPLVGVVVAFKSGEDILIGWSLCNISRNDKFNQYDGIRRAIDRAEPAALLQNQMMVDIVRIPHTCVPFISKMMERARKHFSPREENPEGNKNV